MDYLGIRAHLRISPYLSPQKGTGGPLAAVSTETTLSVALGLLGRKSERLNDTDQTMCSLWFLGGSGEVPEG